MTLLLCNSIISILLMVFMVLTDKECYKETKRCLDKNPVGTSGLILVMCFLVSIPVIGICILIGMHSEYCSIYEIKWRDNE